jgi:hypothetical protein
MIDSLSFLTSQQLPQQERERGVEAVARRVGRRGQTEWAVNVTGGLILLNGSRSLMNGNCLSFECSWLYIVHRRPNPSPRTRLTLRVTVKQSIKLKANDARIVTTCNTDENSPPSAMRMNEEPAASCQRAYSSCCASLEQQPTTRRLMASRLAFLPGLKVGSLI